MVNRFKDQNIVITGGSSGIGLATAEQFASLGANLSLIARDPVKLQAAKQQLEAKFQEKILIETYVADVSNLPQIQEVIQEIGEKRGIHTLINNAGVQDAQAFAFQPIESLKFVMEVNYWGAVYATKAALPYLQKAKNGQVSFVGSVGSYTGVYGYAAYGASKFAMNGLAECLRIELKPQNIGVTILFPPDTDTPLLAREQEKSPPETIAMTQGASLMTAEAVAKKFVKGMIRNRFEVICNFESKGIRLLKILMPQLYFKIIDGMIAKIKK